jgi:hypothetical protein
MQVVCPACGRNIVVPSTPEAKQPAPSASQPPGRTSGKAVASLVLGLPALFFCMNILTGIPAIIFGVLGLKEIGRSGGRLQGKSLAATGIITGTLGILALLPLVLLIVYAVGEYREIDARTRSFENLRDIGLALEVYEAEHGQFPGPVASAHDPGGIFPVNPIVAFFPASAVGLGSSPLGEGPILVTSALYLERNFPIDLVPAKPLPDKMQGLSWRVTLLPYLGEGALYNQFHLDEPWDSPNNLPLLKQIPKIYEMPGGPADVPAGHTFYQAVVGPGAVFDPQVPHGCPITAITDGPSTTLMIAEAANAVPWTKPDDLSFTPNGPLPQFGTRWKGGFLAVFADREVHWIPPETPDTILHAYITRNGGEVVTLP